MLRSPQFAALDVFGQHLLVHVFLILEEISRRRLGVFSCIVSLLLPREPRSPSALRPFYRRLCCYARWTESFLFQRLPPTPWMPFGAGDSLLQVSHHLDMTAARPLASLLFRFLWLHSSQPVHFLSILFLLVPQD